MLDSVRPRPVGLLGPLARLARIDLGGPLVVVVVVFALLIGVRLSESGGDPTGLVVFGKNFASYTHPPRGAIISDGDGYDGQFFWLQSTDPLLLHDATVADFARANARFRTQRVAYPALAFALGAGQHDAILWTLIAINLAAVVALTYGFARYARSRGWSGWWALAIALLPGLELATLRDLSDTLAVATMFGGLLAWRLGRRWWAAGLLAVAALTREPMVLAALAVAIEMAIRGWHGRHVRGELGRIVRHGWPVVAVPAAAFFAWQAYIDLRFGTNAAASSSYVFPLKSFFDEIHQSVAHASPLAGAWELCFLALIALGLAASVTLWRSSASAVSIAALLFGLSLLPLTFGDFWSYTRLSAPMFAALLLTGLEQGNRFALTVCATAAALTLFIPAMVG
jgi:hypothetical protein